MGIALFSSFVILPDINGRYQTIFEFLTDKYPGISKDQWAERIVDGKVSDSSGITVTLSTPFKPREKIYYYRESGKETPIPFSEKILFINDHILVACKPHFLPVIPAGRYVNECLLYRLRKTTGNDSLTPVNRIDMDTAGIVLFSINKETRSAYHGLFTKGDIHKEYKAVTLLCTELKKDHWLIKNRLIQGEPWFLMKSAEGMVNAKTEIFLRERKNDKAYFEVIPLTGKKHQIRIHLSSIGCPILNDRYYPVLQPETEPDFNKPLQLLAKRIRFKDPISGKTMEFESSRCLL